MNFLQGLMLNKGIRPRRFDVSLKNMAHKYRNDTLGKNFIDD